MLLLVEQHLVVNLIGKQNQVVLAGNRGYILGGWKIVSLQPPGKPIALDNWMLFDIENGSPGVTTAVNGFNNNRFGFNTQGFLLNPTTGTIRFCDGRGATAARAWVMSATGRLTAATDTNNPADGVVNDHATNNIACP